MIKTIPIKSYCSIENLKSFFALCKPRVNALIVFTAVIGMFLSTPGMVPFSVLISAILGIGFVSGAAAAFNCLIEEKNGVLVNIKDHEDIKNAMQKLILPIEVG